MRQSIEHANLFPWAVLVVDQGGTVVGANEAAQRLLQLEPQDLEGRPLTELVSEVAGGLEPFLERTRRSAFWLPSAMTIQIANGSGARYRVAGSRAPVAPGEEALLYVRFEPRKRDRVIGNFIALNDKIGQLAGEIERRQRAEALLADEKAVLERIAAGASLEHALEGLVHLLESQVEGLLGSILLLGADGRLHHGAGPSLPRAYIDAINGVKIGPSVGSCGTAAHRGEVVVVADIQSDPLWADYRELAASHGLRACWSIPIRGEMGQVVGTLACYYPAPRTPLATELDLAKDAAHVAGIAISRHAHLRARTRLLEEARRGQAQAEASNKAKDRFLAMLGHELRNPVGAIMSAAEALDTLGEPGEEAQKLIALVLRQGAQLRRILDDLLDMARVDAGKLSLKKERLDLAALAGTVLELATPAASEHAQSVALRSEPVWVDGDPTRLEQVIRNLLDNAIKYTPDGGTIEVSVVRENDQAIVSVRDDGVGMDAECLESAFEPFSQAPQSLVRSNGGLGLGLPLAKRLVELHAGTVSADSAGPGLGTRVEVRLPALADLPRSAGSNGRSPTAPTAEASPPARSVVLVEDNADARFALNALLSRWGHRTAVAADGESGLELALKPGVEVALIDIGLPLLDGYELARAIRAAAPGRPLKLVAMTGYGRPEDRRRALEAGFDLHLVKPVSANELRAVLEP